MVSRTNVGIIGIQGAVSEHINIMKKALKDKKLDGDVIEIKNRSQIDNIDGLIIPGGESTTISRIISVSYTHLRAHET